MKPSSISGLICYVDDLERTGEFYRALGFRPGKRETDRITCYVNWFWITFLCRDSAARPQPTPGAAGGAFTCIKVDDLDDFYSGALAAGLRPESEPAKGRSGNREFDLVDPDGYRLTFFEKK